MENYTEPAVYEQYWKDRELMIEYIINYLNNITNDDLQRMCDIINNSFESDNPSNT